MIEKNKTLIEKIKNHSMKGGNKQISEKNYLKSMKFLQKATSKKTSDILKLSIFFSITPFTVNKIKRRRTTTMVPRYLKSDSSRVSLAIKNIIQVCRKKKGGAFSKIFYEEILLSSQEKGLMVQKKKDLRNQIRTKRIYKVFYRW